MKSLKLEEMKKFWGIAVSLTVSLAMEED